MLSTPAVTRLLISLYSLLILTTCQITFHNFYSIKLHDIRDLAVCSPMFGKLGTEQCMRSEVEILQYSPILLYQILSNLDSNYRLRRISLVIHLTKSLNPIHCAEALDDFLTPRPWWAISKESVVKFTGDGNVVKPMTAYSIFLTRHYQPIEPFLRHLAAIQFPPQEVCAATRLGVGHLVDSGWGAQMGMYGSFVRRHPWVVFNIWDSVDNSPTSGVMYSAGSMCPKLVNKRLCAFLPITNCSMPAAITGVLGANEVSRAWPQNIMMYTSATVSAKTTSNDLSLYLHEENDYQRQLSKTLRLLTQGKEPEFILANFYDGEMVLFHKHRVQYNKPPPIDTAAAYGLIFRPNALYRSLINARIEAFREEYDFGPRMKCVAVHIRRGDRIRPNVNVTEYCANYTRLPGNYCVHKATGIQREGNCLGLDEIGCFSAHPFATLSLQDYLDRAWKLLPTPNVFVMTDDGNWLEQQLQTIPKQWNVMVLAGKRVKRTTNQGTKAGVDFMASIALAKQCQAFVGHWSSSLATLVFRSMCMQHWRYVGQCPLACNIGGNNI